MSTRDENETFGTRILKTSLHLALSLASKRGTNDGLDGNNPGSASKLPITLTLKRSEIFYINFCFANQNIKTVWKSREIFSTECTYLLGFYSLIVGGFYQSGIKLFTMHAGCLSRRMLFRIHNSRIKRELPKRVESTADRWKNDKKAAIFLWITLVSVSELTTIVTNCVIQ